jgi:hypothetical protein
MNAQYNAGTIFSGYVDITPDTLMNYTVTPYTHELYGLNIFGDAGNDVEFTAHGAVSSGGSSAYISITALNPDVSIRMGRLDSVYVPANSNWNVTNVARPLNGGEAIDAPGAVWNNTILYLTDHSGAGGGNKNVNDFIGGDKYIGLRYQNSGNLAYGWIRVQCPAEDACYVKDYSFTPATVGIFEKMNKSAMVYPNPAGNIFYIKNIDRTLIDPARINIRDIYGKNVSFTCDLNDNPKITLDDSTPCGCYFLEYYSGDQPVTVKIMKATR